MRVPCLSPALLACGLLLMLDSQLASATDLSLECDLPEHQRTLHAEHAGLPHHARALWLDDRRIRWPGATPGARYRLHHSARAALVVKLGAPVTGADDSLVLESIPDGTVGSSDPRHAWAGSGPELTLREADLARIAEL